MDTVNASRTQRRFSTDSELKGAKPEAGSYELTDTQARGLRLRVQPSGSKRFWYRYKGTDGKSHRILIGEYGHNRVTLTDARAKRHELAVMKDDPTNPDPHEVIAARDYEKAAQAREKVAQAANAQWTVKVVGQAYVASLEGKRRPRTVYEYKRQLERYVYPVIGDVPMLDVTDDMIRSKLLAPLEADGHYSQRNSLRVTLLGLFKWCRDKERGTIKLLHGMHNPLLDVSVIRRRDLPKGYGKAKEELPPAAVKALWGRFQTERDDHTDILALQLLCGTRVTETALAQWRHIDLDAQEWRISGNHTKTGHPHRVHLSPQAVELLSSRQGKRIGAVFQARADATGKKLTEYLEAAGFDADVYGTHSLRKTVATGVIEKFGYRQEVRRHILNHTSPDALESVYVKAEWAGPAAEALDKWGSYLDGLIDDKVTPISKAAS